MVTGARSVAGYLGNTPDDRLLALLSFSFDYGFSQLSTAFLVGARVVLMEYLLPQEVVRTVEREVITGLAGVPPMWIQLAAQRWPDTVAHHVRYITNSGGTMPVATLAKLRAALPSTKVFLMYGLTEAFRSTYLAPEELDRRPGSIGKAIPNAEILVLREDGSPCGPDEPGELVHCGPLVAQGYWNDPKRTAERFRPLPQAVQDRPAGEVAVWSGDVVRADAEGYLYFIGRRDEMIKTSGYRVSPTEVEEEVHASGLVADAVALGVPHARLGQALSSWRHRRPAPRPIQTSCRITCGGGCRVTWCRSRWSGGTSCRARRTASSTVPCCTRNSTTPLPMRSSDTSFDVPAPPSPWTWQYR